jgi:hypothetical protein
MWYQHQKSWPTIPQNKNGRVSLDAKLCQHGHWIYIVTMSPSWMRSHRRIWMLLEGKSKLGYITAGRRQKAGLPVDQSTGYATESLWRSLVPLLTHPTDALTLFAAILYYTCPVRLNSLVVTLLMLQPWLPKDPALRAWLHEGETKLVVIVD